MSRNPDTESLPKKSAQRINVKILDRHGVLLMTVMAAATLRGAQPLPVGRAITGARKSIPLHKRFHPLHGMTVLFHPIPPQSRRGQTQKVAGQMRHANPRQNEKPAVVGQTAQAGSPTLLLPADELIAGGDFPGRRAKEQTGPRLIGRAPDQLSDVLARRPAIAQVMRLSQPALEKFG